jgi:hypothetical protein
LNAFVRVRGFSQKGEVNVGAEIGCDRQVAKVQKKEKQKGKLNPPVPTQFCKKKTHHTTRETKRERRRRESIEMI